MGSGLLAFHLTGAVCGKSFTLSSFRLALCEAVHPGSVKPPNVKASEYRKEDLVNTPI